MSKRVSLSLAKPRIEAPIEDWIADRHGHDQPRPPEAPPEPTVRLTLDIPKSMHKRLKGGAVERETTIADVIRDLLAKEFPVP